MYFTTVSAKRIEASWRLSICCQVIAKFKVKQFYLIYSRPFLVIFIFFYTWELHCQHIPISSSTWSKSHNFKTARIVSYWALRSSRFAASSQSTSLTIYGLRSTVCSLWSVVCSLQMSDTAIRSLRTKDTFLAFLYHFCDSFICVRRIFPCIGGSCWRCRDAQC